MVFKSQASSTAIWISRERKLGSVLCTPLPFPEHLTSSRCLLGEDVHRLVVNVLLLCAPCVAPMFRLIQRLGKHWYEPGWEPGESVICNAVIDMVISRPAPHWLPKTDFVSLSLGQEGCE